MHTQGVPSIDLDTPARRRSWRRGDPVTLVAAGALAGVLLGVLGAQPSLAPAEYTAAAAPAVVVVTASPQEGAAAAIWQADGRQVTAPWGQPVEVVGPAQVSVFTRAGDGPGASCSITVDGAQVVAYVATGAESVASCAWPT